MELNGGKFVVDDHSAHPTRAVVEYYINSTDDREAIKANDGDLLYYKDWFVIDHETRVALGGSRIWMYDGDRNAWDPQTNPADCE